MTAANTTLERLLVETLAAHGYVCQRSPCIIESFDDASLHRLSAVTRLPLVKLINATSAQELTSEYEDFFDVGVDGLFTDFPHTYAAFLDYTYAGGPAGTL